MKQRREENDEVLIELVKLYKFTKLKYLLSLNLNKDFKKIINLSSKFYKIVLVR
jgi:hypothetical protein